jgi:predicted TIM-barrel fold metal-dependent hydrolase
VPPELTIVDAHQHLGRSMFSHTETEAAELMAALDEHDIHTALVMPQPALAHPAPIHDAIAEAAAAHPGRLFGIANVNPRLSTTAYRAEVRRCTEELGFKALKLHPLGHNVSIASPDARIVFEMADELGVPVLIHTGTGIPHALPALALRPARAFPAVPIILCHAGWSVFADEAIVAAEAAENLYLEPSWCGPYQIAAMIGSLGAERVLYGSDHLNNIASELAKFTSLGLSEGDLALCLGGNAKRLFNL